MVARLGRVGNALGGRPRTTWAEQLSRDLDGMGLWEAWYLAMDSEKWREFATSLCFSDAR